MEGQQISINSFLFQLNAQRSHIRHCLRSYKASCKPWKKEYWKKQLAEAIAKFNKDFSGYDMKGV